MLTAHELTQPYATSPPAGDRRDSVTGRVYRDVNERIREAWRSFDFQGPMQLFCECSRPSCLAPIEIEPERYDAVRTGETRWIVAPSHAPPEAHVITRSPECWVVEERP